MVRTLINIRHDDEPEYVNVDYIVSIRGTTSGSTVFTADGRWSPTEMSVDDLLERLETARREASGL